MAKRTHLTAMGKEIDMGAMRVVNADVPAVGNMGVTASGKKIKKAEKTTRTSTPQTQPAVQRRRSNVTREKPDRTSLAARERVMKELGEKNRRVEAQLEKDRIDYMPVKPIPIIPTLPAVQEFDVESSLMFSPDDIDFDVEPVRDVAEVLSVSPVSQIVQEVQPVDQYEDIDPLALTLDDDEEEVIPASPVIEEPARPILFGLAGAIERAKALQGGTDASI